MLLILTHLGFVYVYVFILTVYDRLKILIDEISCKQERAGLLWLCPNEWPFLSL